MSNLHGDYSAAVILSNSSSVILPSLFASIFRKRVSIESLFFVVAVATNSVWSIEPSLFWSRVANRDDLDFAFDTFAAERVFVSAFGLGSGIVARISAKCLRAAMTSGSAELVTSL